MRAIGIILAGLAFVAPAASSAQTAGSLTPAQQQAQVIAVGQAVAQFHQMYNAGQYAAIWQGASSNLQGTPQPEFVQFMTSLHAKMGDYQSHVLIGDVVTDNSAANAVTISYNVTYANGTAKENFVYLMSNGQPQLAHYSVENIATTSG